MIGYYVEELRYFSEIYRSHTQLCNDFLFHF